jgi:hypothetical protein
MKVTLVGDLIFFFKNWRKVGTTSSQHGPYELGYSRATMVYTKSCNNVNWSESLTYTLVQISFCNSKL